MIKNCYILGTLNAYRGHALELSLGQLNISFKNVWGNTGNFKPRAEYLEIEYVDSLAKLVIGRGLSDGEINCFLGHIEIYIEHLKSDFEWAFILEDDAIIKEKIVELISDLPNTKRPSILLLHDDYRTEVKTLFSRWKALKSKSFEFYKLFRPPNGTQGYLINKAAAKYLFDSTSTQGIYSPCDWPKHSLHKIDFYHIVDPLVTHDISKPSLLEQERFDKGHSEKVYFSRRKGILFLLHFLNLRVLRLRKLGAKEMPLNYYFSVFMWKTRLYFKSK